MMNGVWPGEGLKLSFAPYNLQLKHVFTIAGNSRNTTPVMLTELRYQGISGYGEASMPPYLGESQDTAAKFLSELDLEQFNDPFRMEEILEYIDGSAPGNTAAKAAVDIALHDLIGKLTGQPFYKLWGFTPENTPDTSYTIGIDNPEVLKLKTEEAAPYKLLKVKLNGINDSEIIESIRAVTSKPICIDVNQGWTIKEEALEKICRLHEKGVVFIEQPMPKNRIDDTAWLTQHSPLPIIADEAVQRLSDIQKAAGVYSGINIKLMKCTGMREAHKMITIARELNLRVMIGCMTETSCAISAAAQLSPKADWADLDGNLLIVNDPFKGITIENGKIILNNKPGIGIEKQEPMSSAY